ncbi:hypothetical protein OIDMADRAFT_28684 [Oidiodendron maius Zn]|uniref:Uncharacterized protein n=1 Tax=Oidiodendron maius (strain Zn) TaxID=913774 RepID=A0A0C3CPL0_OIDMZ|nr:hypothetical protein OIDMADRAFT_28684 [Oidiodendron maius Zn]
MVRKGRPADEVSWKGDEVDGEWLAAAGIGRSRFNAHTAGFGAEANSKPAIVSFSLPSAWPDERDRWSLGHKKTWKHRCCQGGVTRYALGTLCYFGTLRAVAARESIRRYPRLLVDMSYPHTQGHNTSKGGALKKETCRSILGRRLSSALSGHRHLPWPDDISRWFERPAAGSWQRPGRDKPGTAGGSRGVILGAVPHRGRLSATQEAALLRTAMPCVFATRYKSCQCILRV